ncbi:RNA polymerase sigma-70 factor (ECF subfamily) [Granulicella arctica]|uniref:RNA polymerase sigma-70 factor (ECF subfamily) n=1 Tax=Granulicella arctica TaxID=940613 RepID=A0A7Y9PIP9_9BACT|nr:RNA polymerase sigma-70 factor (ECF subfamily) [Granulicella arctica]
MKAAKGGDHDAFAELWRRHFKRVSRTVNQITRNPADAEDAVQDTFLKAYSHLHTFNCQAKFSTWLTRIAINSALMILRGRRSHLYTLANSFTDGETWLEWEVQDGRVDIEGTYAKKEASQKLNAAILNLRPPLRHVMQIYQQNDNSMAEIAEIAGLSIPATKSRMLRARRALRQRLTSK